MINPLTAAHAFADAARRGRVVLKTHFFSPVVKPVELAGEWNIPVLNFGRLNNPVPENTAAWTKQDYDALWERGVDLIQAGQFRLPFERCFYLFQQAESATAHENVGLIHLTTEDGEITGEVFTLSPRAPIAGWVLEPIQFSINGSVLGFGVAPEVVLDRDRDEFAADVKATYTAVIAATVMLSTSATTAPAKSPEIDRVNRDRHKAGIKKLAQIINVRIDREAVARVRNAISGHGTTVQPHDRRGHYRTLKSGRVVPVKPSKVHGGSDMQRGYNVRVS